MGKRRGYQGDKAWGRYNQSDNANYNRHGHYGSGGGGGDDRYDQRRDFSRSGYRNNDGYYDHRQGGGGRGGRGGGDRERGGYYFGQHPNSNYYSRTPFHNDGGRSRGYNNDSRREEFPPNRRPPQQEPGPSPGSKKEEEEPAAVAAAASASASASSPLKIEQDTGAMPDIKNNDDMEMKPPPAEDNAIPAASSANSENLIPLSKRSKHEQPSSSSGPSDDDIIVTKENWESASLMSKIKGQYPFLIENFHIRDNMYQDTEQRFRKKKQAAEFAFQKTMADIVAARPPQNNAPYPDESDEDDDIEENMFDGCIINGQEVHTKDPYTEGELRLFTDALPYNLLVDAGFRQIAEHQDDEKNCFCPCHRHSRKWLTTFAPGCLLDSESTDQCTKFKLPCDPNQLTAHLEKIGFENGGFLHRATFYYLKHLYSNYWDDIFPNVDHKALYIRGTAEWNVAVAAEKKYLMNAWRQAQAQLEEQNKLRELAEKQLEDRKELQKINEDLAQKYETMEKEFKALKVKPKMIQEKMPDSEFEERRAVCAGMLKILAVAYESHHKNETEKTKKTEIKVPHKVDFQDFFDGLYEDGKDDKTFFFRDLSFKVSKTFTNKTFHNSKIMRKWDIKFGDSSIKNLARMGLQAVDDGGPTRTFIDNFCSQMGTLAVLLPIDKDYHTSEFSRETSYLDVDDGWTVEVETPDGPRQARVMRELKKKKNSKISRYKVCYDGKNGKKCKIKVERPNLRIREYPIYLFDRSADFCFPIRDNTFEDTVDRLNSAHYGPQMTLDEVKKKAMAFYRAVGRIMLHLIFDPEETMHYGVMPQLLRNFLLRGIGPNSESYKKEDLVTHINEMDNGLLGQVLGDKENPPTFEDYFLDTDFIAACKKRGFDPEIDPYEFITEENCVSKFIPLYLLETRHETLGAMKDGLTLDGTVDITNIFRFMPLEFVNRFLFSNPKYTVETIAGIIMKDDEEDDSNYSEEIRAGRHQFINEILPETLETLSSNNSNFLSQFLYYVTGSSLMPHLEGNPGYRILVEFTPDVGEDGLPMASTCANLLKVPTFHYGNDVDVFMEKLSIAVALGSSAGFGFQ